MSEYMRTMPRNVSHRVLKGSHGWYMRVAKCLHCSATGTRSVFRRRWSCRALKSSKLNFLFVSAKLARFRNSAGNATPGGDSDPSASALDGPMGTGGAAAAPAAASAPPPLAAAPLPEPAAAVAVRALAEARSPRPERSLAPNGDSTISISPAAAVPPTFKGAGPTAAGAVATIGSGCGKSRCFVRAKA